MQQPYAQPVAYAQPGYGQPAASPQAAPVAPVAYVPGAGQPAGAGAQTPQQQQQQAFRAQVVAVARSLEQVIPGYQLLVSFLNDAAASPGAQPLAGAETLRDALKEAIFLHFATLGTIRRILIGETTAEVAASLATGVNQLIRLHTQARPIFDQILAAAPAEVRAALANLTQSITTADTQLNQAGTATQALVGQQIWDAARTAVFGAASS